MRERHQGRQPDDGRRHDPRRTLGRLRLLSTWATPPSTSPEQVGVSREDQDAFAYDVAPEVGRRDGGPASRPDRPGRRSLGARGPASISSADEFAPDGHDPQTLAQPAARLRKTGAPSPRATPPGLNDGAAACVVMSADEAYQAHELAPMATVAGLRPAAGVDREIMGTAPMPATRRLLEKAGWTAARARPDRGQRGLRGAGDLADGRELGWDYRQGQRERRCDRPRPSDRRVWCARAHHLLYEMRGRDARRGLATLCIGGGQGVALAVERAV